MAIVFGYDASGRGNNWTANNLSSTAGAGNDSLTDTPTAYGTDTGVGGTVRGNYATLNPLTNTWSASLTNGNLDYSFTGSSTIRSVAATIAIPTTGSWYWEATLTQDTNENLGIGMIKTSFNPANYSCTSQSANAGTGNSYGRSRSYTYNGITATAASTWNNTSDVIQFAYDATNGKLWFGKNNTWQSGDPAAGTSPTYSSISGEFYPVVSHDSSATQTTGCIFNFGQRAFAYTAPSGFKALCTQNLPTPTIGATSTTQADNYFNVVTRTFTAATAVITGLGFSPDWLWFKRRNAAASHSLYDRLRGTNARLLSNGSNAEITTTSAELTSFDSDGFTVGADPGTISINASNGDTGVVWCWRANGAGSSNTAGSITSTVSVNTTSGFSIVTYTGTGANATVGHGLGVAPSMIIIKGRSTAYDWRVYHTSVGNTSAVFLNTSSASVASSTYWNNTSPTSTVFSLGTNAGMNESAGTYVAYCFAPVAGYSAFGNYTGNGSASGPFVYTGFRPAFVLIKRYDGGSYDWWIFDGKRSPYNFMKARLYANASDAEQDLYEYIDFTSNGIKLRATELGINGNGSSYIYACFAESPFKYSLAR